MATVEPGHEVEAAAMQYHRSGYTILRNAVPVGMLAELQRRFDRHAAAHVKSLGPGRPRGRLTFYELNEDEREEHAVVAGHEGEAVSGVFEVAEVIC